MLGVLTRPKVEVIDWEVALMNGYPWCLFASSKKSDFYVTYSGNMLEKLQTYLPENIKANTIAQGLKQILLKCAKKLF